MVQKGVLVHKFGEHYVKQNQTDILTVRPPQDSFSQMYNEVSWKSVPQAEFGKPLYRMRSHTEGNLTVGTNQILLLNTVFSPVSFYYPFKRPNMLIPTIKTSMKIFKLATNWF